MPLKNPRLRLSEGDTAGLPRGRNEPVVILQPARRHAVELLGIQVRSDGDIEATVVETLDLAGFRATLDLRGEKLGAKIRHGELEKVPVLLKGPTGAGKTRFVEYMSWRLHEHLGDRENEGVPLITVACHEDLTDRKSTRLNSSH